MLYFNVASFNPGADPAGMEGETVHWYICMAVAVAILLLVVKLFLSKSLGKKRMLYIVLCCMAATYALYIPPLFAGHEPIAAILGGFMNTLRVISLDADYLQVAAIVANNISVPLLAKVYHLLLALVHTLLPAVSAMTAVTLIIQYLTEMQIGSIQRKKLPLHVFSRLNYESVMLARDIRAHDKKCDILFLDNKENSDYTDLQQELRCTVLNEQVQNVKARANKRQVCYYCIGQEQEENLNEALAIMAWLQECDTASQQNNHIYLFTTDPTSELIVDSIQKGHVNLSIVDRNRTAVYQLLQEYPLLRYGKNGALHVLICGFGPVGKALLRAVSWVGQIYGYRLRVTVLGKNIAHEMEDFRLDYPNLFCERYDTRLFSYNTNAQLLELLRQQAADAGFVAVCEENSELAVDLAVRLRRFFYREDPAYQNAPPVFCYVENEDKARAVGQLQTAEAKAQRRMSYGITPFGTASGIFSFKNITDSDLEKLSKNVHLVYEDIFSDGPIDVESALERYNLFEVNKSSNRANALHIRYKLMMLGLDYTDDPAAEEVALSDYLSADTLENLTYAEHDRWMAFLDSEGWEGATVAQSKAYQASGISKGRHNCPLLKLHPYICPFEDLAECSEALGLPDSTVYDRDLISRIPDILHDKWGVLGKKYKIVKLDDQTGGTQ